MTDKFTLSKKEAVNIYGSKKQIKHFNKYNKFKNKNVENSLIKTLRQHFKYVNVIKQGRSYVYELSGKRDVIVPRIDRRQSNTGGNNILPYDKEMNSIIINYILKNATESYVGYGLNKWLVELGFVKSDFVNMYYSMSAKIAKLNELSNEYKIFSYDNYEDLPIIIDFLNREMSRLRNKLKSIFDDLSKRKLINYRVSRNACSLNDEHIELSRSESEKISNVKRKLYYKYDVEPKDLVFKTNDKNVIACKEEYKLILEDMGYKYVYDVHNVIVEAQDKTMKNYLERVRESNKALFVDPPTYSDVVEYYNDFISKYGEHSEKYAEKRQNKINKKDNRRINYLKENRDYLKMYKLLLSHFNLSDRDIDEIISGVDLFEWNIKNIKHERVEINGDNWNDTRIIWWFCRFVDRVIPTDYNFIYAY